ncbi:MAG TPA: hypothetical protein VGA00_03900 [Acidiferrobacterales bacterium]
MSETSWTELLRAEGARRTADVGWHFDDPAAEIGRAAHGTVRAALPDLSLLRAGGGDVQTFLQGQLSNDIRDIDTARSQLSAYCTAQGRMLALFRVLRHGDGYLLQLPAGLADTTLKRLKMFVLRAKVTIDNADAELGQFGLAGPQAADLLAGLGLPAPETDNAVAHAAEVAVLRLPAPVPRFLVIAPLVETAELWRRLGPATPAVGWPAWAWLDIRAGLPSVQPGTVEAFVPQMANVELLGGVNFKKGCYPGQEIVARMHYLGRLKQRMVRATVPAAERPTPGTAVYAPDFTNQSAGSVVDAQPAPDGGYDLLLVAQLSSIAGGELHLGSPDGARLTLVDLPYSLPAQEKL